MKPLTTSVLAVVLLVFAISRAKSDISDDECGIIENFDDSEAAATDQPEDEIATSSTNRPQIIEALPDQKSLLIVFDGTRSMGKDLQQLRDAAKKIIESFAGREDKPIANYILSVFRDPRKLKTYAKMFTKQNFVFPQMLSHLSSRKIFLNFCQSSVQLSSLATWIVRKNLFLG